MPMYFKNCFNPKKETLEIPRSSLHRANLWDAEELLLHTGGGYIMVTRNALDTRECLHLLRFLTSIAKSLLFQLVVNSNQDEEFDDDEWDEDYGDMPDGDTPNADSQHGAWTGDLRGKCESNGICRQQSPEKQRGSVRGRRRSAGVF